MLRMWLLFADASGVFSVPDDESDQVRAIAMRLLED
jgi:hypothetical protein